VAVESIVYIPENPLANLPVIIGTGGGIPVQIVMATPGTFDITTLTVPAGRDVTLTIIGGGGGGASGDGTSTGGGGGGGGAGLIVIVPAMVWSDGGSLVIGAGGAGGLTGVHDGTAGDETSLTLVDFDITEARGGAGGHSTSHAGGAGGVAGFDGGIAHPVVKDGSAGATGLTTGAAAGGRAGIGGAGTGGVGGTGGAGAGGAGSNGRAILQFNA
jgi:hypothetical protein